MSTDAVAALTSNRDAWRRRALKAEARLEKLEEAARAWGYHRAIARDPKTDSGDYWANTKAMVQAEARLADVVAALDLAAPPGEGA